MDDTRQKKVTLSPRVWIVVVVVLILLVVLAVSLLE